MLMPVAFCSPRLWLSHVQILEGEAIGRRFRENLTQMSNSKDKVFTLSSFNLKFALSLQFSCCIFAIFESIPVRAQVLPTPDMILRDDRAETAVGFDLTKEEMLQRPAKRPVAVSIAPAGDDGRKDALPMPAQIGCSGCGQSGPTEGVKDVLELHRRPGAIPVDRVPSDGRRSLPLPSQIKS